MESLEHKADDLRQRDEPYALATVVRCESPTSAKPGARGLITRDGRITGWIGGGCAQPIVIEEALSSLKDGAPRLLRITPHADAEHVDGMKTYEMVCHSGGTMDIFVEPVLPAPQLVLLGRSPVARTLAELAAAVRYDVRVYAPQATAADFPRVRSLVGRLALGDLPRPHQSFVVICTQGEDDEGGVREALRSGVRYVALVASPKKWKAIRAALAGEGVAEDDLNRVRVPAGISIHAREPEEIAVSILAEIVSVRRSEDWPAAEVAPAESAGHGAPAATTHGDGGHGAAATSPAALAIDPICHMNVDMDAATYTSDYQGRTYYFCCGGCKRKFDSEPGRYVQ
ncbi:MAG TPA: XdhC family protein [bacterium]|nr:XdhC family protein [bacterium]